MPGIRRTMGRMRLKIDEARAEKRAPRFAPAGQSTQMIIGADASTDRDILALSTNLYGSYGLKRVYYSAFSPIPDASARLPPQKAPLVREHRLYQADWLLRFYEFDAERARPRPDRQPRPRDRPQARLGAPAPRPLPRRPQHAPPRNSLLRIPGLGVKSVNRLLQARRHRALRMDDLARLRLPLPKIAPFIITADHTPGATLDSPHLQARLTPKASSRPRPLRMQSARASPLPACGEGRA